MERKEGKKGLVWSRNEKRDENPIFWPYLARTEVSLARMVVAVEGGWPPLKTESYCNPRRSCGCGRQSAVSNDSRRSCQNFKFFYIYCKVQRKINLEIKYKNLNMTKKYSKKKKQYWVASQRVLRLTPLAWLHFSLKDLEVDDEWLSFLDLACNTSWSFPHLLKRLHHPPHKYRLSRFDRSS